MRITMIGHSTVLIETDGKRLLTDPFFNSWGNPAFARLHPPAQSRRELQNADLVLLSHDHWDHIDGAFLHALPPQVPVLTSRVIAWLVRLLNGHGVQGMVPGAKFSLGAITITAVPAVHVVPTIGFVIQSEGKAVYFAGDTFYQPFLKEIGRQFNLVAALIPVIGYRIPMTMNNRDAVNAAQDLRVPVIIPIHLGIQPRLPLLRTRDTPENCAALLKQAGYAGQLVHLKEGESLTL